MEAPLDTTRIQFKDSDELCQFIRDQTGETVILWFSAGKDSVASWLKLRRFFPRIIPVYREFVPKLGFVEDSLRYYEDFFGTAILRYPSHQFFNMLDACVLQDERSVKVIEAMPLMRHLELADFDEDVQKRFNCWGAYNATGQRAADSMHRRVAIEKYGPIRHDSYRRFFPIFDWKFEDMTSAFRDAGVKLPVDYALWHRSFDSPRGRFLPAIKQHFPESYEQLRLWFPLIDAERMRFEFGQTGDADL